MLNNFNMKWGSEMINTRIFKKQLTNRKWLKNILLEIDETLLEQLMK